MRYFVNFNYNINKQAQKCPDRACFSTLFYSLKTENTGSMSVFMYRELNPKYPFFISSREKVGHILRFDKAELEYVYNRLSDIVDMPEIIDHKDVCGEGLEVKFIFEKKSAAWVKTILTISRYFYEKYLENEEKRDLYNIMRDTIDYCKINSEVSFIETFQLFHYDSSTNNGHACVSTYPKEYPTKIVSQESFVKKMNDYKLSTVYGEYGIFYVEAHQRLKTDEIYSFDNVSKI